MAFQQEKKLSTTPDHPRWPSVFFVLILMTLITFGATIPFYFESQSLWYKFGIDKTLLRTGKIIGITTAIFLLLQLLLAVRLPFLVATLGVKKLLFLHKITGILLFLFGFTHATLILLPEGLGNLPIGKKYWPEMVGMSLLFVFFLQVFFGLFRQYLGLSYRRWRIWHKLIGYFSLALLWFHVPFVSESFQQTVPLTTFLVINVILVSVIGFIKLRP